MDLLDAKASTFLMVAREGSFSKAAKALYVSSVSVMKQMNAFESQMGVTLFDRRHTGAELTDAGHLLARRLHDIARECDAAVEEARTHARTAKRTIRIGTSLLRPCRPLVDLCASAGSRMPFRIEIVPFDDGREALRSAFDGLGESIDCFVGPFDTHAQATAPNFLKLMDVDCRIGVPAGHRLYGERSLTWHDLDGESLTLVKEGESSIIDAMRRDIIEHHPGITIIDAPFFYDLEVFNRCVASSTLMETLSIWTDAHPAIATLPMDWGYTIPFGIVYPAEPNAAIRDFITFISELTQ